MAKAKTAKEATETTETTERAAKGSSIQAQCKDLVQIVANELKTDGEIAPDTLEWLNRVASEIADTQQRNLPPVVRLEKAQAERNAVYLRAGVKDGVFSFASAEDEHLAATLSNRIERLKKQIADEATGDED